MVRVAGEHSGVALVPSFAERGKAWVSGDPGTRIIRIRSRSRNVHRRPRDPKAMRKIHLHRAVPDRLAEQFALDLNESQRTAVTAHPSIHRIRRGAGN